MKNVIKKIVAVTMAFTMLGTGMAITQSVSPNSENILIAKAYSNEDAYITNATVPNGNMPYGKSFSIKGIIHSKYKITKVYGGVYYYYECAPGGKDGLRKTDQYYEIDNPSLNYKNGEYLYDLSTTFDKKIKFGMLSPGIEYTYVVCIKYLDTKTNKTIDKYTIEDSHFSIISSSSSPDVVKDFCDVDYGWYTSALQFVYCRKIMNGKGSKPNDPSKKYFDPLGNITRAEIAQVLYNHMGSPNVKTDNLPFSDMKKGEWYEKAVCWANQSGVVKGYPDGKFGINYPITREELIQMLYNYAVFRGYKTVGGNLNFDNICSLYEDKGNVSSWAKNAVAWAVDKDVIDVENQDKNDGRHRKIAPQEYARRAECAQLIKNLLENARY